MDNDEYLILLLKIIKFALKIINNCEDILPFLNCIYFECISGHICFDT